MIQIRNKRGSVAPAILTTKGAEGTAAFIDKYNAGETDFEFLTSIYGHDTVKDELKRLQAGKCCFCESRFGHVAHGDIEHFRPKAGWIQDKEKLNKPGYYWLAYNWDNLLLSCQICNQSFKRNFFALAPGGVRATNHNADIKKEKPMFVHPVMDDPEEHIAFNENVPIYKTERGKYTITKTGLDRETLNEKRRETFNTLKQLYTIARDIPEIAVEVKAKAKAAVIQWHNAAQSDETEYASMLRCFFKKYPIDF